MAVMGGMERLQSLCRQYLGRLRLVASRLGLLHHLEEVIRSNENGECKATEKEVTMLARMLDEERVDRCDIPKIVGKSYRKCMADGTFDKVRVLRRVGRYSRVSAIMHASNGNGRPKKLKIP